MEDILTKENLTGYLSDIGLDQEQIDCILQCVDEKDYKQLLKRLKEKKSCLLDECHQCQEKIDNLDFIVYHIKKSKNI